MRLKISQLLNYKKLTIAPAAAVMAIAVGAQSVPAQQFTFLNETFSDNERLTQDLPTSARWTVGAHRTALATGTLNASAGSLVLDHTSTGGERSFAATWAHFAPAGAPVTVPVGDTMTLSFTVRLVGGTYAPNAGAFRWALFDSKNSRLTTDFAGVNATGISSGTTFSTWRGYEGNSPLYSSTQATAGTDIVARERNGSGNALFDSANWATLSGSPATEAAYTLNTDYAGTLVLTRTATGMQVQASLNGSTTNLVTDTSSPFIAFDTLTFFTTDAAGHDLVFDNVSVTLTPEPASLSLLAVASSGLLARSRRRAVTGPAPLST